MPARFLTVLVTAPRARVSRKLARQLVEARLAACVNEIPGLFSTYFWEGRLHRVRESLLVIKTRTSAFPRLKRFVEKHHGAEVPEIIALSIQKGSRKYLKWIAASVR